MRKTVASLATLVLTATCLVSAVPAEAAATCVLGTPAVTPSALAVLGVSGKFDRTLVVTATNCTDAQARVTRYYWVLQVGDGPLGTQPYPALTVAHTAGTTTTFNARMVSTLPYLEFGDYSSDIYRAPSTDIKPAPTLQFRANTVVTTNATPEPIKQGKTLTVLGNVKRANVNTKTYTAYTNHKVDLQFRTPTGSYVRVKQVYSDSKGNVRTTVIASRDGCYRYVSQQTSTAAYKASVGDCVNVT